MINVIELNYSVQKPDRYSDDIEIQTILQLDSQEGKKSVEGSHIFYAPGRKCSVKLVGHGNGSKRAWKANFNFRKSPSSRLA